MHREHLKSNIRNVNSFYIHFTFLESDTLQLLMCRVSDGKVNSLGCSPFGLKSHLYSEQGNKFLWKNVFFSILTPTH